jgi:hypothetical protein
VKRRLASPRFRRRLLWLGGGSCALAAVVLLSIHLGNTGHSQATPIDKTKKAWVYKAPTHMRLTKGDRIALFTATSRFVRTAVARKQLDSAWDMLGPEMKAGQTRKSWDSGFNNVVPFNADAIEAWDILYAYKDDVALDLSLVAGRKNGDNWAGKTFTLELKRDPSSHRWLVASWVPRGVGGGGTLSPDRRVGPPPPAVTAHISTRWLFLPGVFLAGLLLVLGIAGLRSVVRSRRASRRYAEALGYKSSSSPS